MSTSALESFSHLASGARRIAADPARNAQGRAAQEQALQALDAAALAVLDLVPTGQAKSCAFAHAISSLRPALIAAFPAKKPGEHFVSLRDFRDIDLHMCGSPAYWRALWAQGIDISDILGVLVRRALARGEPELTALLGEAIPATPSLNWLFHIPNKPSRHSAFLDIALTAAVAAYPHEGLRLARQLAQEEKGFLLALLLMAGVPFSALLAPALPPRTDTALRRISAHKVLELCPQPGRITQMFTDPARRQEASKMVAA